MKILLTGGASGLGKAIVASLAADAKNYIYFTYCKSSEGSLKLMRDFTNCKAIKCDFTIKSDVMHLCDELPEMELDGLINNAYTSIDTRHFHKSDPDMFESNFVTNVLSLIRITQAAISGFRKKRFGRIINITTSYLVNKPPVGLSGYVAEKAYISSLSKSWAHENAAFNITSNCIAPSMMMTSFLKNTDERQIEVIAEAHPLKKLLTVDETAKLVETLLQTPAHINGATWVVNGGVDVI